MYNLTVDGAHTFFVGDGQWLVHNASCDVFYVANHGQMPTPRQGVFESHHGFMSQWMKTEFGAAYNPDLAPAVLMSVENHNATRGVYNTWRAEVAQAQGGTFSWSNVSEQQMRGLGEQMFNAANVPQSVRNEYWTQFNQFLGGLRQGQGGTP
jgi:HNH/Endo VII superfamily toxin with a SHH signature